MHVWNLMFVSEWRGIFRRPFSLTRSVLIVLNGEIKTETPFSTIKGPTTTALFPLPVRSTKKTPLFMIAPRALLVSEQWIWNYFLQFQLLFQAQNDADYQRSSIFHQFSLGQSQLTRQSPGCAQKPYFDLRVYSLFSHHLQLYKNW